MINRQQEHSSFSYGDFVWFMGVVEDRMDPKKLGRIRVRIMGYHTDDKTQIPTEQLQWMFPLQPIVSGAMNGIGFSPTGLVEGSWIMGFFRDGHNAQDGIVVGSFGGIPASTANSGLGFNDPGGQYPKSDHVGEPDTNRLARNEKISETIVQTKRDNEDKAVQKSLNDGTWDEKTTPYAAAYPYNHVREFESGHTTEFDDTAGSERFHRYHKEGGFIEIHPDGTEVRKIQKDKYEIVLGDEYVHVKGDVTITIDGDANVLVKGNSRLETEGNRDEYVHQNYRLKVGGKMEVQSGGGMLIDDYTPRIDLNKPNTPITF